MATQVRIISRRNSAEWDHLVEDVLNRNALGTEHDYFGCASQERADAIRRHIRTAAKRKQVGSRVYWKPCPTPGACANGGPGCTHHVYYTLFDMEVARQYKARQAEIAQQNRTPAAS